LRAPKGGAVILQGVAKPSYDRIRAPPIVATPAVTDPCRGSQRSSAGSTF